MELIDTHAHLYAEEFKEDRAAVIEKSQERGVSRVYLPNIDTSTIEAMLALEAQYPTYCKAMMGIHPCHIGAHFEKQLEHVAYWLSKRPFAAMGEIGIDLYHKKTFRAQQVEALTLQLAWAQQYQLPVVIHCRASLEDTLTILEKHQNGQLKGIFHCFNGSLQEAKRIIELGFYLGIGGFVTFKNTGLDQVVASLDLDHLVLETDSPYLAPVPHRGKRNESAYLLYIAQRIATLHGIDLTLVAQKTTDNAKKVFESSTPKLAVKEKQ